MAEIESKRLDNLEDRFSKAEERVIQLDKSIAVYSAIFERNLQIQEKLSIAIDNLSETTIELKGTLIGVLQDIKRANEEQQIASEKIVRIEGMTEKKISEFRISFEEKLGLLDKKIDEIDDKGKFDILKFVKKNLVSILLGLYILLEKIRTLLPSS